MERRTDLDSDLGTVYPPPSLTCSALMTRGSQQGQGRGAQTTSRSIGGDGNPGGGGGGGAGAGAGAGGGQRNSSPWAPAAKLGQTGMSFTQKGWKRLATEWEKSSR